jgi:pimeloyl-ACP methyl ester carboxylesterase
MEIAGVLLFNGSILIERAHPTPAQKVLRSRAGPVFSRLISRRPFQRQFAQLFSDSHPLSDKEAADQWALLAERRGHRIGHRTIRYMHERVTYAERWNSAFRDWPGPLSLAWGMLDPVAVPAVLEGLEELRPGVRVTRLEDLGHYPQVEEPERMAEVVRAAVGGL